MAYVNSLDDDLVRYLIGDTVAPDFLRRFRDAWFKYSERFFGRTVDRISFGKDLDRLEEIRFMQ